MLWHNQRLKNNAIANLMAMPKNLVTKLEKVKKSIGLVENTLELIHSPDSPYFSALKQLFEDLHKLHTFIYIHEQILIALQLEFPQDVRPRLVSTIQIIEKSLKGNDTSDAKGILELSRGIVTLSQSFLQIKILEKPIRIPEQHTYYSGLDEIVKIIFEKLENQQIVVVAFAAYGMHVGKSWLSKDIMKKLNERKIESFTFHRLEDLERRDWLDQLIRYGHWDSQTSKLVILFDQLNVTHDPSGITDILVILDDEEKLRKITASLGISVKGIDLMVGLTRPDRPFSNPKTLNVDLIIVNEFALDK